MKVLLYRSDVAIVEDQPGTLDASVDIPDDQAILIADHLRAAAESVMAHDHASSMVVLDISESLRKAVDVLNQPGSDTGES